MTATVDDWDATPSPGYDDWAAEPTPLLPVPSYEEAFAQQYGVLAFESEVNTEARKLQVREEAQRRHREAKSDLSGWQPKDLADALDAGPVVPDVGQRTDGVGVFYSGKLNVAFGESEGGKTWVALHTAKQVMSADATGEVVYLDYEDDERSIAQRLLTLHVPREHIVSRFHYVNPPGPFGEAVFTDLAPLLARARLVVLDATTEALAREGLDSNSDTDIAEFYNRYPKRIAALGPAVLVIDHVTKSPEGRGQQIGSQFKRAGVDGVAYNVEPMDRFAPGRGGSAMVLISKDKQGGVREHGVFGGEGKQDRFGFFTMDTLGITHLYTVKPAESKEDKDMQRAIDVNAAIRQHLAENPKASNRDTMKALREQGFKFDDKECRGWINAAREARDEASSEDAETAEAPSSLCGEVR